MLDSGDIVNPTTLSNARDLCHYTADGRASRLPEGRTRGTKSPDLNPASAVTLRQRMTETCISGPDGGPFARCTALATPDSRFFGAVMHRDRTGRYPCARSKNGSAEHESTVFAPNPGRTCCRLCPDFSLMYERVVEMEATAAETVFLRLPFDGVPQQQSCSGVPGKSWAGVEGRWAFCSLACSKWWNHYVAYRRLILWDVIPVALVVS